MQLNTIDNFQIGDRVVIESNVLPNGAPGAMGGVIIGETHTVEAKGETFTGLPYVEAGYRLAPECFRKVDDLEALAAQRAPLEEGGKAVVESAIFHLGEGTFGNHEDHSGEDRPKPGDVVTLERLQGDGNWVVGGFIVHESGLVAAETDEEKSDAAIDALRERLTAEADTDAALAEPLGPGDRAVVEATIFKINDTEFGNHEDFPGDDRPKVGDVVTIERRTSYGNFAAEGNLLHESGLRKFEEPIEEPADEPLADWERELLEAADLLAAEIEAEGGEGEPVCTCPPVIGQGIVEVRLEVRAFIGDLDVTDIFQTLMGK